MPIPTLSPYGAPKYSGGAAVAATVATLAALKAITDPGVLVHGNEVMVDADGSRWYYHSTSVLTADDILVAAPAGGTGRWLRAPGTADLAMPFTFNTADAAVLLTVPAGCLMLVRRGYWEIAADMTGGTASAIGLSGPSPHNTKGDLLGGSGGDVAATLTAALSPALGTVGADNAAGIRLKAGDTVKFDRITSAFTAGSGNAHLVVEILRNPGA